MQTQTQHKRNTMGGGDEGRVVWGGGQVLPSSSHLSRTEEPVVGDGGGGNVCLEVMLGKAGVGGMG